jgi:hydroxyethylthiazole kinase
MLSLPGEVDVAAWPVKALGELRMGRQQPTTTFPDGGRDGYSDYRIRGTVLVTHPSTQADFLAIAKGSDRKRAAIFLSQVLLETAQWRDLGGTKRLLHEWGFGTYSAANPATQYYTAFYGREIMQLTWAGNYRGYGEFRNIPDHVGEYVERLPNSTPRITSSSLHWSANSADHGVQFQWAPRYDLDIIGEQPFEACDSGSGGNGYYERQAYTAFMMRFLTDDVKRNMNLTLALPAPRGAIEVDMEASDV